MEVNGSMFLKHFSIKVANTMTVFNRQEEKEI
jgi:hypothetical protein